MLTGKVASARPLIGELEEGLTGSASRKDLETMFQLIYLRFTQPRADPAIFGVMTTQTKAALANQKATPEFAFNEALTSTLTQNHPRARPMTPEMVDEMNLDKSLAFYKDRFGDASDFTFVFVGSFDLPTMKPLVERYLGALPSTHRKETWKDIGMHPAEGGRREARRERASSPRARRASSFAGPFQYNQEQRVAHPRDGGRARRPGCANRCARISAAPTASRRRPGYSKFPREEYSLSIDFGSSPDRTEELVKSVFREIELLKTKGPTDKQVADVKELLLRDLETNSKQNGFLLAEHLFPLPAVGGPRHALRPGGLLQEADRRDDPGGRADLSRHEQLREGDAVPRNEGVAGSPGGSRRRALRGRRRSG